jgi:hypothetical protein
MTKKIPLYDDNLLFLDVLPEPNPSFIEKVKKVRQAFPQTVSQNNGDINK